MGRSGWSAWAAPASWWPSRDGASNGEWQQQRASRSPSAKRQRTRPWRACTCGQWVWEDRLGQRPACPCGRDWPARGGHADSVGGKEGKELLDFAETDPVVAASPYLMPLLRVLGGDLATRHLASALITAEQRKAAVSAPKGAASSAAFSKAHDALRKAEKVLIRTKDDRAAAEAKLAKLVTAEAKAFEEYQKAKLLFDEALANRRPDAEAILGTKMAMLGTSLISIHGQDLTVDTSDGQVQAAMALLLSNASAQAAKAAAVAATVDIPEEPQLASSAGTEDVIMDNGAQAEKHKAEDSLDDGQGATLAGGGLAQRLAGACDAAAASIAAQVLQGGKRGK